MYKTWVDESDVLYFSGIKEENPTVPTHRTPDEIAEIKIHIEEGNRLQ